MATTNLSIYNPEDVPDGKGMKIAIVSAEWNTGITGALADGAKETLLKHGVVSSDIIHEWVPGTFELTGGAMILADRGDVDAVICIGCVVKGETPHFDFICQGVTQGITQLHFEYHIPFIYGVITTNTMEQAEDRAGGKHGNKGVEAAVTALKMVALQKKSA